MNNIHHAEGNKDVDIGELLDEGPWTTVQRIVVLIAALSIVLDGFDGQLIGYAIPVLIQEWDVSRADFAPVVASGLFGMAFGSAFAGLIADRFGRRLAVILSVITFGLATMAIGLSQGIWSIAFFRFIAGLGIGGALPTSTTMTAEYTPRRYRTVAITATIVCVPLGGMLAGIYSSWVLPTFGWRTLFIVGGGISVLFSALLITSFPESPRWLSRQPAKAKVLADLLARIERPVPAGARLIDPTERISGKSGISTLFNDGRALSTVALWTAFFTTLLSVYLAFSWLPTLLTSEGLSLSLAGSGLTAYNLGGVIGALVCAVAIDRFGSRSPLVFCSFAAAATALFLSELNEMEATTMLIVGIGLHGLFVNAVQSTAYAVAANLYPTEVRATGTAAALVIGRLGAISSGFAGATVIASGGAQSYFGVLFIAMAISGFAFLILRKHIPRASH
ncbi:MFS transporter [Ochrobactrum sp. RH2CCR150]|uniref:MFS transporter n=1 Tax=Ochrobactrum sp. RH2CCR150 TaxID=2587044 RepID=UPI0015FB1895|nr:AAHS family 4-hydroxybenzoate transporter-like MFS transporter [Ochrobactrum sp. RH2CCR150]